MATESILTSKKLTSDCLVHQRTKDGYVVEFLGSDFLLICVKGREFWMHRARMSEPGIGDFILKLTGVFKSDEE